MKKFINYLDKNGEKREGWIGSNLDNKKEIVVLDGRKCGINDKKPKIWEKRKRDL